MAYVVTLDVFSGRPNPRWIIDSDQVSELQHFAKARARAFAAAPPPVLGYRGFTLTPVIDDSGKPLGALEAEATKEFGHHVFGDEEVEHYLLKTAGTHLEDLVRQHVGSSIGQPPLVMAATAPRLACPPCTAADAPAYNPGFWNNNPTTLQNNNCYNYANNQVTNTFAQPGRATGHQYTQLTCASVQPAAQSDGLAPTPNFSSHLAAGKGWFVALVVAPGMDFHWYRQDNVGCWSHKPGSTPVRNTDNAGHAITDPRTANRGPYTAFCSFMITKRTVRIR